MKKRLQAIFGVDKNGRPSLPNSRRQLLIAGIICLAIWPGIGLLILITNQLDTDQYIYAIASPYLVVTFLGVYLLGQSLLAQNERPRFKKTLQKPQDKKE